MNAIWGTKAVDGDSPHLGGKNNRIIARGLSCVMKQEQAISRIILIDRGHQLNEIGEGLLEFFDENDQLIESMTVTDIAWEGQPENVVELEEPVYACRVRFTIDPEKKFFHGGSGENPEKEGWRRFRCFAKRRSSTKLKPSGRYI